MLLLSEFFDKIGGALNYVGILICAGIFSVVNTVYKIYMALASAQILTSGMFTSIRNKIYLIIGIAMLFVLAYAIIQGIISPDKFISKNGGEGIGILKRVLIAVLGIALVPAAFSYAYKGQELILKQDIIGKIFLGYNNDSNVIDIHPMTATIDNQNVTLTFNDAEMNQNEAIKTSAGSIASVRIWSAFFAPKGGEDDDGAKDIDERAKEIVGKIPVGYASGRAKATMICLTAAAAGTGFAIWSGGTGLLAAAAVCGFSLAYNVVTKIKELLGVGKTIPITLAEAYNIAAGMGDFTYFGYFSDNIVNGEISFNFFMMLVTGALVVYFFFSFAIDMAIRAVKLTYMQLIAPVPLALQVIPKFKDNFNKWLKTVSGLFFEVFVRLSFVYIVLYLIIHINQIVGASTQWVKNANLNGVEQAVAMAILIIGMLLFAKTAPQFISETIGLGGGKLDLGIGKKIADSGLFGVAAATAGLGSNLATGISNRYNRWKENDKKGSLWGALAGGVGTGARLALRGMPATVRNLKARSIGDVRKAAQEANEQAKKEIQRVDAKRARIKEKADKLNEGDVSKLGKLGNRYIVAPFQYRAEKFGDDLKRFGYVPEVDLGDYTKSKKFIAEIEAIKDKIADATDDDVKARLEQQLGDLKSSDQETRRKAAAAYYLESHGEKPTKEAINRLLEGDPTKLDYIALQAAKAKDEELKRRKNDIFHTQLLKDGSKAQQTMRDFFMEHAEELDKLKGTTIPGGGTLGDLVAKTFGDGALRGKVDFGAIRTALQGEKGFGENVEITYNHESGTYVLRNEGGKKVLRDKTTNAIVEDTDKKNNILGHAEISGVHVVERSGIEGNGLDALKGIKKGDSTLVAYEDEGKPAYLRAQNDSGHTTFVRYTKDATTLQTGIETDVMINGHETVAVKLNDSDVRLEMDGRKVMAHIDGNHQITIDGSRGINLGSINGDNFEGTLNIVDDGRQVTIAAGNDGKMVRTTGVVGVGSVAVDVQQITDNLAAGETTTVKIGDTEYTVKKDDDGQTKFFKDGTEVTGDAKPKADDRATVDEDKLKELAKKAKGKRIKALKGSKNVVINCAEEVDDITVQEEVEEIGIDELIKSLVDKPENYKLEVNNLGHVITLTKSSATRITVEVDGAVVQTVEISGDTVEFNGNVVTCCTAIKDKIQSEVFVAGAATDEAPTGTQRIDRVTLDDMRRISGGSYKTITLENNVQIRCDGTAYEYIDEEGNLTKYKSAGALWEAHKDELENKAVKAHERVNGSKNTIVSDIKKLFEEAERQKEGN